MKPMSKFFLIVSGILVFIGGILLIVGSAMAKSQNIQLFPQKHDGKYVYSVDLENTDVTRISVDVKDADINVFTGQEKEYIEFINFNENFYSISNTNSYVSFEEYVDLSSMLSFWESNFSFKGIRSLFSLTKKVDGIKEVNIYISDERDLNVFDLSVEEGKINISNVKTDTDYNLQVENGIIAMKNVTTTSKVNVHSSASCNMKVENCSFRSFEGDCSTITMTGDIDSVHSFKLNTADGSVNITANLDSELQAVNILTNGTAIINGEGVQTPYKSLPEDIEITKEYAEVNVTGTTLNFEMTTDTSAEGGEAEE